MSELTHGMNCSALTPGNDEECTCGLQWRIALTTEQTMHAAWRKRAEDAEAELTALREHLATVTRRLEIKEREAARTAGHLRTTVGERNVAVERAENAEAAIVEALRFASSDGDLEVCSFDGMGSRLVQALKEREEACEKAEASAESYKNAASVAEQRCEKAEAERDRQYDEVCDQVKKVSAAERTAAESAKRLEECREVWEQWNRIGDGCGGPACNIGGGLCSSCLDKQIDLESRLAACLQSTSAASDTPKYLRCSACGATCPIEQTYVARLGERCYLHLTVARW